MVWIGYCPKYHCCLTDLNLHFLCLTSLLIKCGCTLGNEVPKYLIKLTYY